MSKAKLDARTLRYVARRMLKYHRHYDAAECPKTAGAAFAAGLARMAKKAADECLGTAGDIERKARSLESTPRKKARKA